MDGPSVPGSRAAISPRRVDRVVAGRRSFIVARPAPMRLLKRRALCPRRPLERRQRRAAARASAAPHAALSVLRPPTMAQRRAYRDSARPRSAAARMASTRSSSGISSNSKLWRTAASCRDSCSCLACSRLRSDASRSPLPPAAARRWPTAGPPPRARAGRRGRRWQAPAPLRSLPPQLSLR